MRTNGHRRAISIGPLELVEVIVQAGLGGPAERYVPRPYGLLAALRTLAAPVIRRATRTGAFTTQTRPDGKSARE